MLSHTVPKHLIEHFAYHDKSTRSMRLWRYQKGRAPYRAAPKHATSWNGHFADTKNKDRELAIELRLKQQFEDPVNMFIEGLQNAEFGFMPARVRLLTGYITMLFNRTPARRAASPLQQGRIIAALKAIRSDLHRIEQLRVKHMTDCFLRGTPLVVTAAEVQKEIDRHIARQSAPDAPQERYLDTMENMMAFVDEHMRNGEWRILSTTPYCPFVIGDAPVVTWERDQENKVNYGQGFARPNVEVILPVFPTACLHILPNVQRNREVISPSVDEVNRTQAAFATKHCFTNTRSSSIDAVLQPVFNTVRLGVEAFTINQIDSADKIFDILVSQPLDAYM
jgi:hypothetical protein